ncbi:unnamed protein product [Darwinula stevensoni]|uniref:C2H2-type domain-containing protein n=1 Tax=Darwinula stevensoni TaxID=69355 RepID=A0A7R9A601_9CRUS|nr:unnamed protein product [Darwinula stevensoni]CAG0886431.1 unnamed protein product [Darwinula stevensoni]
MLNYEGNNELTLTYSESGAIEPHCKLKGVESTANNHGLEFADKNQPNFESEIPDFFFYVPGLFGDMPQPRGILKKHSQFDHEIGKGMKKVKRVTLNVPMSLEELMKEYFLPSTADSPTGSNAESEGGQNTTIEIGLVVEEMVIEECAPADFFVKAEDLEFHLDDNFVDHEEQVHEMNKPKKGSSLANPGAVLNDHQYSSNGLTRRKGKYYNQCDICHLYFAFKEDLKAHRKIHWKLNVNCEKV